MAIFPVVAPLLAFQVISTIMLLKQFKGIHEKLERIEKNVSRIIQRNEATFIGEILSAVNRIGDIEGSLNVCKRFSPEMMVRLALVEDKVNPIFERYKFLYQSQEIDKNAGLENLNFKQNDAYLAIILSVLDLRIDYLRVKQAIQESPEYVNHLSELLVKKASYYKDIWFEIGNGSLLAKDIADELKSAAVEMNWWQKTMPEWLFGKSKESKQTKDNIDLLESHAINIEEVVKPEIYVAKSYADSLIDESEENGVNLIYWQDENGEHSYYTDDVGFLSLKK